MTPMVLLNWSLLLFLMNLYNFLQTRLVSTIGRMLTNIKYHLKDWSGQHYNFRNENHLGLITFVGQVRNSSDWHLNMHTRFSPDQKPFWGLWKGWQLSCNSQHTQDSSSLFRIQPVTSISFTSSYQYSPQIELSLDEGMILWRSCLKYRSCDPGKNTKNGLLEWCVELKWGVQWNFVFMIPDFIFFTKLCTFCVVLAKCQ
jgi:hypothetical protein